jgi:hypothetical protein
VHPRGAGLRGRRVDRLDRRPLAGDQAQLTPEVAR